MSAYSDVCTSVFLQSDVLGHPDTMTIHDTTDHGLIVHQLNPHDTLQRSKAAHQITAQHRVCSYGRRLFDGPLHSRFLRCYSMRCSLLIAFI